MSYPGPPQPANQPPDPWSTSPDYAVQNPGYQQGYPPPAQPGYEPLYPTAVDPGGWQGQPTTGAPGYQPGYAAAPQPGYQQPGYQQPGYDQAGYPTAQPGYEQPGYQQPGYQQPGYQQPGYQQPGYQQPGYPGAAQPWPAPPTPQPKKSRGPLIAIIVIVAVLVVCGGGVGLYLIGSKADKTTTTTAGSTPSANSSGGTGSSKTPTSGAYHHVDLTTVALPRPAGAKPWDSQPTDQVLDIDTASQEGASPSDYKAELKDDGYVDGLARYWKTSAQLVEIRIYQFDSTSGAHTFYEADDSATSSSSTDWDNAPGTWATGTDGFVAKAPDNNGDLAVLALGQQANFVVAILVWTVPPANTSGAHDLLTSQLSKIKSGS